MKQNNPFNKSSTAEDVTRGLDLAGQTILITGCNSGIGFETMRVLALRGARVLGAARTLSKAASACAKVEGNAAPLACDLSEPDSVRAAVAAIDEPLNAIVANAGVMALQEKTLQYGVEGHFFTNHVGHFILVTGLLKHLTKDGRLVVLASGAHSFARGKNLNFEDLSWNRPYKPWAAYGYSKLANILFSLELAKRLPDGQTANALHPGIIDTALWRNLPVQEAQKMKSSFGLKTVEFGAATSVFLAVHPSVAGVTGSYFSNCAVAQPSVHARDDKLGARLWDVTETLVGTL
jgi:NAD(P)-dependent dehydrogenase (short-subunit alcohol dehydrogenase family)